MLKQGLAFRAHGHHEGNFIELLKLRADDDPDLSEYLQRKTNYTSPQVQNEIMESFSHEILRKLIEEMKKDKIYAVMVDGTTDKSGEEQECICIRHFDSELKVNAPAYFECL